MATPFQEAGFTKEDTFKVIGVGKGGPDRPRHNFRIAETVRLARDDMTQAPEFVNKHGLQQFVGLEDLEHMSQK